MVIVFFWNLMVLCTILGIIRLWVIFVFCIYFYILDGCVAFIKRERNWGAWVA